ncbi:MAG: hypothetical protein R3C05_01050 [Pirellulaceae bacterium]
MLLAVANQSFNSELAGLVIPANCFSPFVNTNDLKTELNKSFTNQIVKDQMSRHATEVACVGFDIIASCPDIVKSPKARKLKNL